MERSTPDRRRLPLAGLPLHRRADRRRRGQTAAIILVALVALFASLMPLLRRVTAQLEARNRQLAEQARISRTHCWSATAALESVGQPRRSSKFRRGITPQPGRHRALEPERGAAFGRSQETLGKPRRPDRPARPSRRVVRRRAADQQRRRRREITRHAAFDTTEPSRVSLTDSRSGTQREPSTARQSSPATSPKSSGSRLSSKHSSTKSGWPARTPRTRSGRSQSRTSGCGSSIASRTSSSRWSPTSFGLRSPRSRVTSSCSSTAAPASWARSRPAF